MEHIDVVNLFSVANTVILCVFAILAWLVKDKLKRQEDDRIEVKRDLVINLKELRDLNTENIMLSRSTTAGIWKRMDEYNTRLSRVEGIVEFVRMIDRKSKKNIGLESDEPE